VLAAVINANPLSTERYRGNQRHTYCGRCLVVLKSPEKASDPIARQADGLDGAKSLKGRLERGAALNPY
jgi:hypothetical protein